LAGWVEVELVELVELVEDVGDQAELVEDVGDQAELVEDVELVELLSDRPGEGLEVALCPG